MSRVILKIVFLVSFLLALIAGSFTLPGEDSLWVSLENWFIALFHPQGAGVLNEILWQLRIPEAIAVALSGFGLGFSGVLLQGFFRNPLADPALLGISAGAAFFVVFYLGIMMLLGIALGGIFWALPLIAFFGAIFSMLVMLAFYKICRGIASATLLLAGIGVSTFFAAISSLIFIELNNQSLHLALWWSLGGGGVMQWKLLGFAFLIVLLALLLAQRQARALDVAVLGELEARSLGVNFKALRLCVFIAVALASGASVALTGPIAFIGLISPHMARRWFGFKHKELLWMSGLLGGSLLLVSSVISRLILIPMELPLGIVSSFLGVPFFFYFLLSKKGLSHV